MLYKLSSKAANAIKIKLLLTLVMLVLNVMENSVEKKLRSLKKHRKVIEVIDERNKTGEGRFPEWDYFDKMDAILGHRPATQPPVVVNSMDEREVAGDTTTGDNADESTGDTAGESQPEVGVCMCVPVCFCMCVHVAYSLSLSL